MARQKTQVVRGDTRQVVAHCFGSTECMCIYIYCILYYMYLNYPVVISDSQCSCGHRFLPLKGAPGS